MKYILLILITSILALTSTPVEAQAWERNSKVLTIGVGASQFYHFDNYYHEDFRGNHRSYKPLTGQFNLQMEFGIHKYVGLGFSTGVGGRSRWSNHYRGEVNIPFGILSNFHFYQLIADKSSKNLHADKLDIYGGVSAGSGIAITFYRNKINEVETRRIAPLAFGGLHAGIRYYFKPNVGVTAEVGFGQSLANIGFAFKF
ncbi:MAG: hypothetical protein WD048_12255 [Chitinophagales bacterium]